jgi:glucuronate isomerase
MSQKLVKVSPKTIHIDTGKYVYTVIALRIQIAPSVAADDTDPIDTMVLNAENPQWAVWLAFASNFRGITARDPYRWAAEEMDRYFTLDERMILFKTHLFARETFEDLKGESKIQFESIEHTADEILTRSNLQEWIGRDKFAGDQEAREVMSHV